MVMVMMLAVLAVFALMVLMWASLPFVVLILVCCLSFSRVSVAWRPPDVVMQETGKDWGERAVPRHLLLRRIGSFPPYHRRSKVRRESATFRSRRFMLSLHVARVSAVAHAVFLPWNSCLAVYRRHRPRHGRGGRGPWRAMATTDGAGWL